MKTTAEIILDTAQDLIQTRGYSAMSFQDVAAKVGIRKPSVIHHFPSKAALGKAVVERYRLQFAEALERVAADPGLDPWDQLNFYFTPYRQFADTPDTICLCGALAGEFMVLPLVMQAEVERFFHGHQDWLETMLRNGLDCGAFTLTDNVERTARMIFSALQGALMVRRALGDETLLENVIHAVRAGLKPPSDAEGR